MQCVPSSMPSVPAVHGDDHVAELEQYAVSLD